MTRKKVTLRNVFEFNESDVDDFSDDALIERAKEAFYLEGAPVSAKVKEID